MTTNPPTLPPIPGGKPAVLLSADCQKCAKRGLPWIAVIDTVIDKADAAQLAAAGHSYPAAFDPAFASFQRSATAPAARLPGAGFVWVLYEDLRRRQQPSAAAEGPAAGLRQAVAGAAAVHR
jgi:hypothetical protein